MAKVKGPPIGRFEISTSTAIGPYIVDFVSFEKRVVVDLDGGQHAVEKRKDIQRDAWLEAQGYQVLRFWNNEVLKNIEGVLEAIERRLLSPSPLSPPTRGGERNSGGSPPTRGEDLMGSKPGTLVTE